MAQDSGCCFRLAYRRLPQSRRRNLLAGELHRWRGTVLPGAEHARLQVPQARCACPVAVSPVTAGRPFMRHGVPLLLVEARVTAPLGPPERRCW